MVYVDEDLMKARVIEERRLRFEQFVREQQAKGSKGMTNAALHCIGYRDSYGPVVFENGKMRKGLWVIAGGKNDRLVIYTDRAAAQNYAKSLLPILKNNGYGFSKVWVEEIAVRNETPNAHCALMAPAEGYEDENRYIIRMKVL